jgi:hypothetical protein
MLIVAKAKICPRLHSFRIPWNDLLSNNCQKKIYPARPVEPGTLRVFNWG